MDDADLDGEAHRSALRGLSRINAISGVDRCLWRHIAALSRQLNRTIRVLDVAAGSADVLLRVARRAQLARIDLDLHACDLSDRAMDEARNAAKESGVLVTTYTLDAVRTPLPPGFDLAYCGLFMHHLDEPDAQTILKKMSVASDSLLVQDLRRTRRGLALAHVVPRLLTRSRIVHIDAIRSVHGAYTIEEMADIAHRAGLSGARVTPSWPQRFVLSWTRPNDATASVPEHT